MYPATTIWACSAARRNISADKRIIHRLPHSAAAFFAQKTGTPCKQRSRDGLCRYTILNLKLSSLGVFSALALLRTPRTLRMRLRAGFGRQSKDYPPSASLRSALFQSTQRCWPAGSIVASPRYAPRPAHALARGFRTAIQGLLVLSLTSFGAVMRTLLVSPDLTSDRASATGGCPRFVLPPFSLARAKNPSQI